MNAELLMKKAAEYLPLDKVTLVEQAYQFALKAHAGQKRKSGEPYMEHPVATALILADVQLDDATLAAALLHDVPEDCGIPVADIRSAFGSEVAKLVDAATKLSKVTWKGEDLKTPHKGVGRRNSQAENLRRMLIAMAEDLRVVFIKLADRLHNMRTLAALSPERRLAIARETLEIYAPLAHRLGIWQVKWQLEDLAFRYLDPGLYHKIARLVATRRAQRESLIKVITESLQKELASAGIEAEVTGRPKHIYSINQKMEKYAKLGKDFGDIHDLFAFRVLVQEVSDCYKALGVIHGLWHPLSDEFDDFIANPRDNGYQSLHTTVLFSVTTPIEIQIKTYEMHRIAEYGLAAHWRYKEGETTDHHFENKLGWLRQLVEWQRELSSEEFMESVKTDIFIDQVFVYTPEGEIIDLPKGATPLDFAYRIHSELGSNCVGAKVNNRLVPLNYELKNGEIVEVLASKKVKGPSLDWLNPDSGYIKTSHAREKIRAWFKRQERGQNIERGRQLLDKELKRLGMSLTNTEDMAKLFEYDDVDDFFAALGYGGISPRQVVLKWMAGPEQPRNTVALSAIKGSSQSNVEVYGVGDLLTRLARCCHPLPGDEIIGYITRSRGVTVHRKDCPNMPSLDEAERRVTVNWGSIHDVYPAVIQIDSWDRVGLLRDVTTVVAGEKLNIGSVNLVKRDDASVSTFLTIETASLAQLTRLLSKIQGVRGVISVARKGETIVDSKPKLASKGG